MKAFNGDTACFVADQITTIPDSINRGSLRGREDSAFEPHRLGLSRCPYSVGLVLLLDNPC